MGLYARYGPPRPAPTPSRSFDVTGTVETFDGSTLVVRTSGGQAALRVGSSTDYILLKAGAGANHVTAASVRPGARVSIDAWQGDKEASALIVRVVEEGRAMP